MSEMENNARDLLTRTLTTISVGALWMLINSTLGLMFGLFFFENKPTLGNYIFYFWFVLSLGGMIWFFIRLWKKKFPVD